MQRETSPEKAVFGQAGPPPPRHYLHPIACIPLPVESSAWVCTACDSQPGARASRRMPAAAVLQAMGTMNNRMNIPALAKIMKEFERQNAKMDQVEEMMGDAMDDVFEVRRPPPRPPHRSGCLYPGVSICERFVEWPW